MARKLTREKVALVVFILLVVGAALALGGYFIAARTLNVAANQVDETLGMMDDYTVIIYPGTVPPAEASTTATVDETASDEDPDAVATHAAETSAEGIEEALDAENAASGSSISVADVFRQYTLKGASVLSLNDADPTAYAVPRCYRVGTRTIGVLSIDAYTATSRLEPVIEELRAQGADLICLLTPRQSFVADPALASIILVTGQDETLHSSGGNVGSPFVVASPQVGAVGVIAISSSNIISASLIEAS